MNSVLPFTYTLSAQVYVNDFAALGTIPPAPRLHPITPPQPSPTGGGSRLVATGISAALIKNTGSAPAHRHYPNPPTPARVPAALPPPPWGRDGVGAASTPQSDKYKIAHRPYSPAATALPPPSQDAPASAAGGFPRKMHSHFAWGPGEGRGGGSSVLASATDAKLPSCNPATITRIPTEQLPPPVGEGRGGVCPNTADVTKTTKTDRSFTYTLSAQMYVKHPNIGCALAQHLCLEESSIAFSIAFYYDRCACPSTTESAATNPTPALPHRGREPFRYASGFRSPNNHSARGLMRSLLNPATTTRIPAALPPPLQDAPASAAGEGVNCPRFSHRFTKPF